MSKLMFVLFLWVQTMSHAQSVLNLNSVNPFALRETVSAYSKTVSYFANKPVELFLPTSVYVNNSSAVSHDISVLTVPVNLCSVYDRSICYNLSNFYKSINPQAIISGYYFFNKNDAIIIGLNTGFNSPKLVIQPSIELGYSTLVSLEKNVNFVFEGSKWLGGHIEHKPCADTFDREYYCGNLSAWSDFHYQSHVNSYTMRFLYQWKFR